jgi:hypothetical protein
MILVTYVLYVKTALDRHHRNQHGDKEGRYFFFNFKFELTRFWFQTQSSVSEASSVSVLSSVSVSVSVSIDSVPQFRVRRQATRQVLSLTKHCYSIVNDSCF